MAADAEQEPEATNDGAPPSISAILLAGDVVLFLVFALLGRSSHHERHSVALLPATRVAAPFLAGWLTMALITGAYSWRARRDLSLLLRRTALAWLGGCLIALGLRSVAEHRVVPLTFAAIAFSFNLVTLSAWRSIVWLWMRRRG